MEEAEEVVKHLTRLAILPRSCHSLAIQHTPTSRSVDGIQDYVPRETPLETTVRHLIGGPRILGGIGADMVIADGAIPLISRAVKISVNHGNAVTEYKRSFPG
ncbi:hypothetical protein [Desulfurococcus amylolyticus]|uniref:hypothetical protein n=1 Tax=Desulfurococcus amylolyticus TaxID=94694 RepID=UPI0005B1F524|nr:hypothetical protein [Desulfurococcus amylolyticus]